MWLLCANGKLFSFLLHPPPRPPSPPRLYFFRPRFTSIIIDAHHSAEKSQDAGGLSSSSSPDWNIFGKRSRQVRRSGLMFENPFNIVSEKCVREQELRDAA